MTMADDFDPPIGIPQVIEPNIRRIVAPNPSPMTYKGTNTYLVGTRDIAVIDPGPADERHLTALLSCVTGRQRITQIIVTHSHLDHSPLAARLSEVTGAPVLAFGGPFAGRSPVMQHLADAGLSGGGEGIDLSFSPDICVSDGEVISGSDWALKVIHTPGHLGNHIALAHGDICFTGDHVMGWASSLVSPPDGDLTDFMASCARLKCHPWRRFLPGHGDRIEAPHDRLEWLISHRKAREAAILDYLADGPANVVKITHHVYHDTPAALIPAAQRNVIAHLIDLQGKFQVAFTGPLDVTTSFERTDRYHR
ncbi:MBL fold metallo-hydrolase [Roseobacter sp. OBYS 0001]|uniref:MBL fold metallo-hydrolase n=1 Tax=Roseobacter sp. OBYS 0001 TaxID=882651 RepID=UPI001BC6314A|nr:MBL fold metallo-hydrolase [Roseobacter sp. OBYS 0001]GIT87296.1 MBL fold hydrolase [Roseobacter sp. OBYS 0001]